MIRTKHIDPEYRDTIEKIFITYLNVFNTNDNILPCINLTEHATTLKNIKPVNIKGYKPLECHKRLKNK